MTADKGTTINVSFSANNLDLLTYLDEEINVNRSKHICKLLREDKERREREKNGEVVENTESTELSNYELLKKMDEMKAEIIESVKAMLVNTKIVINNDEHAVAIDNNKEEVHQEVVEEEDNNDENVRYIMNQNDDDDDEY